MGTRRIAVLRPPDVGNVTEAILFRPPGKNSSIEPNDPISKRKARERGEFSTAALALPGIGGTLGNATHIISVVLFQPMLDFQAKGAQKVDGSAPVLPLLSVPTPGRRRSEITTMKLRLRWGLHRTDRDLRPALVEFRTAEGGTLAIFIPRSEAAVQVKMPYMVWSCSSL
jgi:hypothetical protein